MITQSNEKACCWEMMVLIFIYVFINTNVEKCASPAHCYLLKQFGVKNTCLEKCIKIKFERK